jgi:uncharacterized protein YggE
MKTSALTRKSAIVTALVLAGALIAPAAQAAATRHVTVSAQGTVTVVPDAVRVNATASNVAATSKAATAATATSAKALRAAVLALKVDARDISTQNLTVYPEYTYGADGTSSLTGYRASQSFTIVVRAASTAGDIVDAIVEAGSDNIQINSATPFVLDTAKSTASARAAAVKNAKAKATSYASLLGVKLGKVSYLVENSSPQISPPIFAMAKAESDATVIDLGQQDVTVSITIRWSLA